MKTQINEILRALRVESGLTQKELAEKIGSTSKNLWVYEKGNAIPPIDILAAYADFFEVSVDYLIGREDDFGIKKSEGAAAPPAYSKEEQKIIEDYRRLNYMSKKLVLQTLATLQPSATAEELQKKNKNG